MQDSAPTPVPRILIAASIAAWLSAAVPATAADTTLRLQGQLVSSSADPFGLNDDFGTGPGAYLGFEYRWSDRLGVELGAGWAEFEQSERQTFGFVATEVTASLTVVPVTVALDIHLTPQKRYDLYLAPKIGWAFFDDFEFITRIDFTGLPIPNIPGFPGFPGLDDVFVSQLQVDDQFIFGLRLGFDIPFGKGSWSFSSSLDYTDMPVEFEIIQGADLGLDPLALGAGVAYRF